MDGGGGVEGIAKSSSEVILGFVQAVQWVSMTRSEFANDGLLGHETLLRLLVMVLAVLVGASSGSIAHPSSDVGEEVLFSGCQE